MTQEKILITRKIQIQILELLTYYMAKIFVRAGPEKLIV